MNYRILFFSLYCASLGAIETIPPHTNIVNFLSTTKDILLHLGCGEAHFSGYINIDYPPSDHTVQSKSGADIFGDVTTLIYPAQSITQIRSHHFFEHFNRQRALALLAIWHHALKEGGTLVIETPDFQASIAMLVNPAYSYADKQKIMRHIFGSHEAFWAYHYDGWYAEKFRSILQTLGFSIQSSTGSSYLLTRNITIVATKTCPLPPEDLQRFCHELLKEHCINTSPDEIAMWRVWCTEFDAHFFPFIIQAPLTVLAPHDFYQAQEAVLHTEDASFPDSSRTAIKASSADYQ